MGGGEKRLNRGVTGGVNTTEELAGVDAERRRDRAQRLEFNRLGTPSFQKNDRVRVHASALRQRLLTKPPKGAYSADGLSCCVRESRHVTTIKDYVVSAHAILLLTPLANPL